MRAGGRKGRHKGLMGYPSLSICWLPVQIRLSAVVCVCVCVRRGLTSLCTPPVSQHTLIGSDLGMTHHMPTPHAPSDLHLPLSSFPSVPPFMHLCSSPPPNHPHTLIFSPGVPLFLFTHISHRACTFSPVLPHAVSTLKSMSGNLTMEAE